MNWSTWKPMPSPEKCREIEGPVDAQGKNLPGVYQIRRNEVLILFGISKSCRRRMKSFFPAPYGTGTRNNTFKRQYILENWNTLEYRYKGTNTREEAKLIEDRIKVQKNHLFNT
jgi:hypothetical protein